jgi:hypothetical protein
MPEPRDTEGRATSQQDPAFGMGQTGMDGNPSQPDVNLTASTIRRLLRASVPARDVFWVAVLHGAANETGWHGPASVQRAEYEATRGQKWSAARFRRAAEELELVGLMEVKRGAGDKPSCLRLTRAGLSASALSPDEHGHDDTSTSNSGISSSGDGETEQGSTAIGLSLEKEKILSSPTRSEAASRDEDSQLAVQVDGDVVRPKGGFRDLTRRLVEFWARRSGRERVRTLPRRVRMVMARIREGYEEDDLYRAIAGVCYSPFHREGGYDTFEVALRNGEQVEKGIQLWKLHAPVDFIIQHEERTGETVETRTADVEAWQRREKADEEYARKLSKLQSRRDEEARARADEARRDEETTALALASATDNGDATGEEGEGGS